MRARLQRRKGTPTGRSTGRRQTGPVLEMPGSGEGDRVAVFLENSPESIISLFGILKSDAVFLMLSASMKSEKLSYVLSNCGVRAIITDSRRPAANREVFEKSPSLDWAICTEPFPEVDGRRLPARRETRMDRVGRDPANRAPVPIRSSPPEYRSRPRIRHLYLGVHGEPQGSDAVAPEHGFRREIDHDLS